MSSTLDSKLAATVLVGARHAVPVLGQYLQRAKSEIVELDVKPAAQDSRRKSVFGQWTAWQ